MSTVGENFSRRVIRDLSSEGRGPMLSHTITSLDKFKSKSLEELRFEDYKLRKEKKANFVVGAVKGITIFDPTVIPTGTVSTKPIRGAGLLGPFASDRSGTKGKWPSAFGTKTPNQETT